MLNYNWTVLLVKYIRKVSKKKQKVNVMYLFSYVKKNIRTALNDFTPMCHYHTSCFSDILGGYRN